LQLRLQQLSCQRERTNIEILAEHHLPAKCGTNLSVLAFAGNSCRFSGLRPFCRQKSVIFGLDSGSVLVAGKIRAKVLILPAKWVKTAFLPAKTGG